MMRVSENDPNAESRPQEAQHLRERIRMLEEENTHLIMKSAFMEQRLRELEAKLRASDPICASNPEDFPIPSEEDPDAASG
jgi:hypothetical protein